MNGMHRMQFHHACFNLLPLVIWSCVFWPSVSRNLCKVLAVLEQNECLTSDRCHLHSVTFGYYLLKKGQWGEGKGVIIPCKLCFIPILSLPTTQWGLCGENRYTRVNSRNWPMRVKWAPFCNFRGPFFKKGVPQKVFELVGTDCSMRKWTFIDALPPFWNILGNWKSQGLNYCRILDVCLVK